MLCPSCKIEMAVRAVSAQGAPIERCVNPRCPRYDK